MGWVRLHTPDGDNLAPRDRAAGAGGRRAEGRGASAERQGDRWVRLAAGPAGAAAVRLVWACNPCRVPVGACCRAGGGGLVHPWALALPGSQPSARVMPTCPLLLWQGPPGPCALALSVSRPSRACRAGTAETRRERGGASGVPAIASDQPGADSGVWQAAATVTSLTPRVHRARGAPRVCHTSWGRAWVPGRLAHVLRSQSLYHRSICLPPAPMLFTTATQPPRGSPFIHSLTHSTRIYRAPTACRAPHGVWSAAESRSLQRRPPGSPQLVREGEGERVGY